MSSFNILETRESKHLYRISIAVITVSQEMQSILLDNSRIADGLTQSRFPSSSTQLIPTFSLWWIGMLHDYWMYTADSDFVKNKLPGERQILSFFHHFQDENGSLVNLPYWDFTDWVDSKGWEHGVAPRGNKGNSSILDLQLLWAYELAGEMENEFGMKAYAQLYQDTSCSNEKDNSAQLLG